MCIRDRITFDVSIWNLLSKLIVIFSTSFILADTSYIPYVGFNVIILSIPGLQKILITKSINSSVPLHKTRLS